jgi:hypothetical protein
MYIGNMIQGRNTTVSYKIHQCRAVPKEDWIRVTGTHEAIIDPDTFRKAQNLLGRYIRKPPAQNRVHLLSGFVRCAKCGRIMSRKTNRHPYGTYHYYRCVTNNKMKTGGCMGGSLRADRIEHAVLTLLQNTASACAESEKLLDQIRRSNSRKRESADLQNLLTRQKAERERCRQASADLYPDWKSGILTQEEYMTIKANLNEKLKTMDESIRNLEHTARQYAAGKHSAKVSRLPKFLESLNQEAGYTVCDNEKIYIKDPSAPDRFECAAILATHTGNTSVYSFAAEVEYHAKFLTPLAKIKIPFFGRSVYDSAIRADMTVGDTEFQGPAPFHHPESKIVKRQYALHRKSHS